MEHETTFPQDPNRVYPQVPTPPSEQELVGGHRHKNMDANTGAKINVPPAVQNAMSGTKAQADKTMDQFKSLGSRSKKGVSINHDQQYLTHFHSIFYDLFTWKFPRATALTFASALGALFIFKFVNVLGITFKYTSYALAASLSAEVLGRRFGGPGFITQYARPRRYMVIPREKVDSMYTETHEFLNFIVLEFQRLLFTEDAFATAVALVAFGLGYFAIKFIPLWYLSLLAIITAFTAPLVYLQFKDQIDEQVDKLSQIVNDKMKHGREISSQYASDAINRTKNITHEYTGKIAEFTERTRQRAVPEAKNAAHATGVKAGQAYGSAVKGTENASHKANETYNAGANKASQFAGRTEHAAQDSTGMDRDMTNSGSTKHYTERDFPETPRQNQDIHVDRTFAEKTEAPIVL